MLVDDHGRQVRIGIYGLAIDHRADPAILLTRLAADEAEAGYRTLPGGGLDGGEHPLEGLRREVRAVEASAPGLCEVDLISFAGESAKEGAVSAVDLPAIFHKFGAPRSSVGILARGEQVSFVTHQICCGRFVTRQICVTTWGICARFIR